MGKAIAVCLKDAYLEDPELLKGRGRAHQRAGRGRGLPRTALPGGLRPWLILVVAAVFASPARADESKDELKGRTDGLIRTIKDHKKAKDVGALLIDIKDAETLYEDLEGVADLRKKVVDAIGSISKGTRSESLIVAVLHSLADLGDLRGAKYIKPFLKQRNVKKSPQLLRTAVAAAAEVPAASLVAPLLSIVVKSKTYGVTGLAVESLGHYGKLKRHRIKILEALVKTTKKSKPGGTPRSRGPSESPANAGGMGEGGGPMGRAGDAGARWGVLRRTVPKALNALTGLELSQIEDWFIVQKENKGRLGSLFTKDE